MALRARPIAASTRLLPSRCWRRTAGPQPKQVLGYLAASGPLMEARSRDRSGSWRPFRAHWGSLAAILKHALRYRRRRGSTVGDRPRSSMRSGAVGSRCRGVISAPSVLCGCAGSARVSLAVHVWRRETARPKGRRFGLIAPRSDARRNNAPIAFPKGMRGILAAQRPQAEFPPRQDRHRRELAPECGRDRPVRLWRGGKHSDFLWCSSVVLPHDDLVNVRLIFSSEAASMNSGARPARCISMPERPPQSPAGACRARW
jgi:hypothetical protein